MLGLSYYIASSLGNAGMVKRLHEVLRLAGHTCTYDWTAHGRVYKTDVDPETNARVMGDTAAAELAGVLEANVVVVILPGGKGTHVELGTILAVGEILKRMASVGMHPPSRMLPPSVILAGIGANAWDVFVTGPLSRGDYPCAFHFASGIVRVGQPDEEKLFASILTFFEASCC